MVILYSYVSHYQRVDARFRHLSSGSWSFAPRGDASPRGVARSAASGGQPKSGRSGLAELVFQGVPAPKNGLGMVLPWFYYGFTMVLLWFYHGFTMVYHGLLWFYYGFAMVLLWFYRDDHGIILGY